MVPFKFYTGHTALFYAILNSKWDIAYSLLGISNEKLFPYESKGLILSEMADWDYIHTVSTIFDDQICISRGNGDRMSFISWEKRINEKADPLRYLFLYFNK